MYTVYNGDNRFLPRLPLPVFYILVLTPVFLIPHDCLK